MRRALGKRDFLRAVSAFLASVLAVQSTCYADYVMPDQLLDWHKVQVHAEQSIQYSANSPEITGGDAERARLGHAADVELIYAEAYRHLYEEAELARQRDPVNGTAELKEKIRSGNYYYPNRKGNAGNPDPEFEVKVTSQDFDGVTELTFKVTKRSEDYQIPYVFTKEVQLSGDETLADIIFGYDATKQYLSALMLEHGGRVKHYQVKNAPNLQSAGVDELPELQISGVQEIERDLHRFSDRWRVYLRAVVAPAKLSDVLIIAPFFAGVNCVATYMLNHVRGVDTEHWTIAAAAAFTLFLGPLQNTLKRVVNTGSKETKFFRELPVTVANALFVGMVSRFAYGEHVSLESMLPTVALTAGASFATAWLQRVFGSNSDMLLTINYALKNYQGEKEHLKIFGIKTNIDRFTFHQRVFGILTFPAKLGAAMASGDDGGLLTWMIKQIGLVITGVVGLGAAVAYTKLAKDALRKSVASAGAAERVEILDKLARLEEAEKGLRENFFSMSVLYLNHAYKPVWKGLKKLIGGCRSALVVAKERLLKI